MTTSASQTYIAKLGFQDKDRNVERHGLACEYMFHRLLEMEIAPYFNECRYDYLAYKVEEQQKRLENLSSAIVAKKQAPPLHSGSYWIEQREVELRQLEMSRSETYDNLQVAIQEQQAFASSYGIQEAHRRLKPAYCINRPIKQPGRSFVVGFADVHIEVDSKQILGEVKITKQSPESILQQINFYETHLRGRVSTYILTDFDCSDLQRMVEGTHVQVFRLGRRFEQWLASRSAFEPSEL
jgi:hypothetical protein